MVGLTLLLVLGAAEEGTPPRFHGEVAFSAGAVASSAPAIGFGAGVRLEAGVRLADEYVLSVGASVAGQPFLGYLSGYATFGLSFGFSVTRHLTVSFGAVGAFILNLPLGISLLAPIRLTLRPGADDARTGLVIGFEAGPGVLVWGITGRGASFTIPSPALSGALSIGYGVW